MFLIFKFTQCKTFDRNFLMILNFSINQCDPKDIINNHVNDKKEVVGDPKRSKNSKNSFGKICSESYFEQLLLKEFPWFKSPCGIPNEPVGNKEFWLKRQWWELC